MKKLSTVNQMKGFSDTDYFISIREKDAIGRCNDSHTAIVTYHNGRFFLTLKASTGIIGGAPAEDWSREFSVAVEITKQQAADFLGGEPDSLSGKNLVEEYQEKEKNRQVYSS